MKIGDRYKVLNATVMGLRKDYKDGDVVEIVKVEGSTGRDKYGYAFPEVWVGTCLEPVVSEPTNSLDIEIEDCVFILDPDALEFDGVPIGGVLRVTDVDVDGDYVVHNPYGDSLYNYTFNKTHMEKGFVLPEKHFYYGDSTAGMAFSPDYGTTWVWGPVLEPDVNNIQDMKVAVKDALSKFRQPKQADGKDHYTSLVVEPLDLAYLNDLDAAQVKVLKYIMRHKTKGGADDVRKAIDVCQKILQYEYGFGREE